MKVHNFVTSSPNILDNNAKYDDPNLSKFSKIHPLLVFK